MSKGLRRSLKAANRIASPSPEIVSVALGSPAVGATTAVHAAVQDTGEAQEVTTGITDPAVPRNITATAGGASGDIKAIQVTIEGVNILGELITEVLPAFTVDTPGTVVGSKAFARVTKITIPAHDGTGATTAIGTGAKIGLPFKLSRDTVLNAYLNGAREATRPTVVVSASAIESNHVTLNSALNSVPVIVDLYK